LTGVGTTCPAADPGAVDARCRLRPARRQGDDDRGRGSCAGRAEARFHLRLGRAIARMQWNRVAGGKFNNYSEGNHMSDTRIKEHMEIIGADGVHIGTVDRVENGRIKLIKADSGMGSHKGHHHYIDLSLVADVEGQKVRLSANGAVAVTMEEEARKPG
jgi:hypothetical protein